MEKINDGGLAFPNHPDMQIDAPGIGMTLRDYLAVNAPPQSAVNTGSAIALVGRNPPEWKPYMQNDKKSEIEYHKQLAKFSIDVDVALRFMWADAMIAARYKENDA
jgi:hypothetical protein